MSHTSQRRGFDPARPNQEFIILVMSHSDYRELAGVKSAMSEMAVAMLRHGPVSYMSKNFTALDIPELPLPREFFALIETLFGDAGKEIIMQLVGQESQVITATYNDRARVVNLLSEIRGDWLARNRQQGYPISVVLSTVAEDGHGCCQEIGLREHTYLHSLGFFGNVQDMPSGDELAIATMCGHGLISIQRIRNLVEKVRSGTITATQAGEDIAKPCVCGIANPVRAATVFQALADA
jgi:hypothetical protein